MGIERSLSDRKGKNFCELPEEKITNSKSRKKNRRRHKKVAASPVQKLFDTCKDVFVSDGVGIVPPPQHIQSLQSVLDGIKPEDVGLTPDMPYFLTNVEQRIPRITYLHIYECEKFSVLLLTLTAFFIMHNAWEDCCFLCVRPLGIRKSLLVRLSELSRKDALRIGIFCLPPSGVIPLHNHPGMTVFSKLLFGTMHIKSYDWVVDLPANSSTTFKPSESLATETQLAKVKVDADFTAPCNPSILYPADGGNLHCFTAVTACAVLDVLGPPYSDPDGRHCTYYLNHPFSTFSVDGISIPEEEKKGYEWLQERVLPDDVEVVGHLYSGPKIMET